MIFLNSVGPFDITHSGVEWTFANMILGVMSNQSGTLEAASNLVLGSVGTFYPGGFAARGLEDASLVDGYSVVGKVLTVNMRVTEPGDWIRVVTASPVPLPAALPLFGTGLAAFGLAGWRRRKRRTAINT